MRTLVLFSTCIALLHLGCGGADAPAPPVIVDPIPSPLSVSLEAQALGPGDSAEVTVHLREAAPEEGALVDLSTNDAASLAMPYAITIAAGEDVGTFVVVNSYSGEPKLVVIGATYGNETASFALFIPSLPPEPPVCKTHACTR